MAAKAPHFAGRQGSRARREHETSSISARSPSSSRACCPDRSRPTSRSASPIPLSGPYAASGGRNRTAVALAVEDLNARGGVLGQKVRLVEADDACGIEQAVAAARQLVDAGVRFVVGHMCSHASLMAAGFYEAFDILMISPDSTHPRLTEEGRRNVFRLVGRDDRQGALAGDFLARPLPRAEDRHPARRQRLRPRPGRRRRACACASSAWSRRSTPPTRRASRTTPRWRRGCDGTRSTCSMSAATAPDAGAILRTAREQGDDLQLVGGDAPRHGGVLDGRGRGRRGRDLQRAPRDPLAIRMPRRWRTALRVRGRGPGAGGIGAYAAVEVWAQAVERAGTTELAAVAARSCGAAASTPCSAASRSTTRAICAAPAGRCRSGAMATTRRSTGTSPSSGN